MKRNTFLAVLLFVIVSLFFCGALCAAEFSYSGDKGPGFWADLDPEWWACAGEGENARQSPIDINNVIIDPALDPLELLIADTKLNLQNNGHAIVQVYDEGSYLTFKDVEYKLLQFHFHTLSEHTIGGQRGVMELHAVFKDISSDNLAVIGMLYTIGLENQFLHGLIDAGLPEKENDGTTDGNINLAEGLTETSSYFTYLGSLTTPPCSETVTWIVLKKAAEMSAQQFREFRDILGNDFRPLQDRNSREIRATAAHGKSWHNRKRIRVGQGGE